MPNWGEVLEEINKLQIEAQNQINNSLATVRSKYLEKLHTHTGRNVISYYSGFLSKPHVAQSLICDEDKNGFMMAIHNLDRSKGLDLILHTQGGDISATQSIVDYLHKGQGVGNNLG